MCGHKFELSEVRLINKTIGINLNVLVSKIILPKSRQNNLY